MSCAYQEGVEITPQPAATAKVRTASATRAAVGFAAIQPDACRTRDWDERIRLDIISLLEPVELRFMKPV